MTKNRLIIGVDYGTTYTGSTVWNELASVSLTYWQVFPSASHRKPTYKNTISKSFMIGPRAIPRLAPKRKFPAKSRTVTKDSYGVL